MIIKVLLGGAAALALSTAALAQVGGELLTALAGGASGTADGAGLAARIGTLQRKLQASSSAIGNRTARFRLLRRICA